MNLFRGIAIRQRVDAGDRTSIRQGGHGRPRFAPGT